MDFVPDFTPEELEKGASAEPSAVSLYCLLFHSRDTALDCEVGDYVLDNRKVLNEVFGPRLQGFAIEKPAADEAQDDRAEIYEYARLYGVGVDRLPCAVFITTIDFRKALRLPFGAFLPPKAKRESDDIALAFRAIATAADSTADVAGWHRISSFHRTLRSERRQVYGDRIPAGSRALSRAACEADAINRIATSGRSLLALAAATTMMFGGTTTASAPAGPPSVHPGVTKSIDGTGGHDQHDLRPTPKR